jgi:hypothetical protein
LLHSLVEDKDNRPGILTAILNESYTALIDHDLTKMTPRMVEDAMESYNVTGDTKRKAVTFFLRAAKFVGMPMHPLLSGMVRNSGPRKRKMKRLAVPELPASVDPASDNSRAQGSTKAVRLSNGGMVTLTISSDPFTLPSKDREFVFGLVDMLQGYADAHAISEEEEEEDQDG